MEQFSNSIVDISYQQTGAATAVNALGMREMQALAYEARDKRFLLIKAPPASGKSRALMFIALDKLVNQGIKKVVVAVPEKSIGRSFKITNLMNGGFFANWEVPPYFNLTDVKNEQDKKGRFKEFFLSSKAKVLVCAHATLRNATKELSDDTFNDTLLAIDEFHHTSADANSNLGDVVRRVMYHSSGHIIAMTGSYFRGDGIPVLRPEDEAKFFPITYNYYQQLNGYKYLKNLILGYHFYHGSYLDHIGEVLDTHKKTIVHIPSVNQRAATGLGKYQETADILKVIGTLDHKEYNTGIYYLKAADGRMLKVADLVEDEQKERNMVQAYLQNIKDRDDVDIIIALGTAKEGFDWQWCEMCLTVGVRGSLTEVIQIIGRCTRDCEGKETARFVNMIAMPEAEQAEVKVAVNDFLKAITASLLMEQVMAPSWKFKTVKDTIAQRMAACQEKAVEHFRNPILGEAAEENNAVRTDQKLSKSRRHVNECLRPKSYKRREAYLNEGEVEEVRQRVLLDTIIKGNDIVDEKGNPISTIPDDDDDKPSEGNRLIKIANRFINIDKLSINLIDTINPFQRAYEVISKSVDAKTLKVIQDTIAEQKYDMTLEQAITLFKGPLKEYVAAHDGKVPSVDDPDPKVRELAIALQKIKNLKQRKLSGLEYEE